MQLLAGLRAKKGVRAHTCLVVAYTRRQAMERELWDQLYSIVVRLDKFYTKGFFRAAEIVMVFLWAVIHDRPTSWACERRNWVVTPPSGLPSQSTMSRRLRTAT